MEAMLRDLPPLRYPISEGEAAAFMEAYRDLPEGPSWDPILVKAEDIEERKRGQARAFERHQRALQKWFRDGRLEAVDTHHAPVPALITGTFIPRHQAVAYLERCGLEHSDMRSSKGGSDAVSHEDSQSEPSTDKRAVGVPKYSESKQKQIVEECRRLQEKKEPGFAKKIAKKYGYSEKQLYNLRKKFEQEGRELQSASRRVVRP
ncbi:helix-turn-helix domain-containing protein [Ralstonia sp. 25C]|uniref:helix-turn-helix domain-containing protein n=1 Tax=Ralstonia sp. 25C TaxID=3447363 RepID=UPI003F74F92E